VEGEIDDRREDCDEVRSTVILSSSTFDPESLDGRKHRSIFRSGIQEVIEIPLIDLQGDEGAKMTEEVVEFLQLQEPVV